MYRFRYKKKIGTSLRDVLNVHLECVGELPDATKTMDVLTLRNWISEEPSGSAAAAALVEALRLRRNTGGAASSSAGVV